MPILELKDICKDYQQGREPVRVLKNINLTVEQYRSAEMNGLYHQYLGAGPLNYVADLLGSQEEALLFYGPMYLLYSVYDGAEDKVSVYPLLDAHLERWRR